MVGKFQEKYPDIDVEIEKIKDDSEYWNAMKMRASANQLPDVMFNKTFTLARFKEYLLDLSDTEAAKNNELAAGYAIDGKILGIPMTSGYEYVYYWKDMFKEAGVEVPTTWGEFEDVAKTLQDYYGKDNANFMAIACGFKDEWPDYPYMEFMPALESGNGQNWNTMQLRMSLSPREQTSTKHTARLMNCSTPVSWARILWVWVPIRQPHCSLPSRQPSSHWVTGDSRISKNQAEDTSELGAFYLPTRNTTSDPYNVIVQGDSFMGVTTHSRTPKLPSFRRVVLLRRLVS